MKNKRHLNVETPLLNLEHSAGKTSVYYTRRNVAVLIGVNVGKLRAWQNTPGCFQLPPPAFRSARGDMYSAKNLLAAINRVNTGPRITRIPACFHSRKAVLWYFRIGSPTFAAWRKLGMPCFVFSSHVKLFLLPEVTRWLRQRNIQCSSIEPQIPVENSLLKIGD